MPAIPIITAAAGVYGTVKGVDQARRSANQANDAAKAAANGTGGGAVNIAALDQQARDIAVRNAAESAALERQYNPGAQELRSDSLGALLGGLQRSEESQALADMIMAQAGRGLNAPGAQQYDSALTRRAVEAAAADLALGGELPQDVRNLVARQGFAKAGTVAPGSGLGLGRDIVARDLGLTSLDLRNRRLQNAAALAQQEAALGQGNASLRQRAAELGLQAEQYGRANLFDSANFINGIESGDFSRALSAAQLGQNIAAPASGLDPGSVVNLAIGNSNIAANAAQNAAAAGVQAGNQKSALGGQILGAGLGLLNTYLSNRKPATPSYSYTLPTTTVGSGYGSNIPSVPGWTPSR